MNALAGGLWSALSYINSHKNTEFGSKVIDTDTSDSRTIDISFIPFGRGSEINISLTYSGSFSVSNRALVGSLDTTVRTCFAANLEANCESDCQYSELIPSAVLAAAYLRLLRPFVVSNEHSLTIWNGAGLADPNIELSLELSFKVLLIHRLHELLEEFLLVLRLPGHVEDKWEGGYNVFAATAILYSFVSYYSASLRNSELRQHVSIPSLL